MGMTLAASRVVPAPRKPGPQPTAETNAALPTAAGLTTTTSTGHWTPEEPNSEEPSAEELTAEEPSAEELTAEELTAEELTAEELSVTRRNRRAVALNHERAPPSVGVEASRHRAPGSTSTESETAARTSSVVVRCGGRTRRVGSRKKRLLEPHFAERAAPSGCRVTEQIGQPPRAQKSRSRPAGLWPVRLPPALRPSLEP